MLIDLLRLSAWFMLLAVIFIPLEQIAFLRPQKIRRREVGNDLVYFFLSGLLPKLLLAPPMALIAFGMHKILPGSLLAFTVGLPLWARALAALLAGEIGFYWGHRWMHEIPLLWRFHAVHHSAASIDWLVNTRLHPVDMVFTRLCGFVPMYALGLAQPTARVADNMPLLIILVGTMWGFFIHANLRWRFGPLEHLVSTPAFHHWHHSKTDHPNRNYASMLPWLDRIFGTHYLPREWPADYGVDPALPRDLAGQMLHPFEGKGGGA